MKPKHTGALPPVRRAGKGLYLALALLSLAVGLYALASSSYFLLVHPTVLGNRTLSRQEVLGMAGLRSPTNLLLISPRSVARRLERSPWIQSAVVTRRWPRDLTIVIREREPVALLEMGKAVFLTAGDGIIMEATTVEEWPRLPVLRGVPPEPVEPGKRLTREEARQALGLLALLTPQERAEVELLEVLAGGGLRFQRRDGARVEWGRPEELTFKVEVYRAVLSDLDKRRQRAAEIDLSNPSAPIARLARPE
ncbi:MAG: FtsQ-type POTRA domain-containing protein [Bacillota bacterium]|nr:FtsQ-type POTRA domain-containing protein [Bacillota bacterium]